MLQGSQSTKQGMHVEYTLDSKALCYKGCSRARIALALQWEVRQTDVQRQEDTHTRNIITNEKSQHEKQNYNTCIECHLSAVPMEVEFDLVLRGRV